MQAKASERVTHTHTHTHKEAPRFKRSRYSDPGPRGRDREPESAEQKLESLILRVGEKVKFIKM